MGRADDVALGRLLEDDPRVPVGVGRVLYGANEVAEVLTPAESVGATVALRLVRDEDRVDGIASFVDFPQDLVELPMGGLVERRAP